MISKTGRTWTHTIREARTLKAELVQQLLAWRCKPGEEYLGAANLWLDGPAACMFEFVTELVDDLAVGSIKADDRNFGEYAGHPDLVRLAAELREKVIEAAELHPRPRAAMRYAEPRLMRKMPSRNTSEGDQAPRVSVYVWETAEGVFRIERCETVLLFASGKSGVTLGRAIDWSIPSDDQFSIAWMRQWLMSPRRPFTDAVELTYGVEAA